MAIISQKDYKLVDKKKSSLFPCSQSQIVNNICFFSIPVFLQSFFPLITAVTSCEGTINLSTFSSKQRALTCTVMLLLLSSRMISLCCVDEWYVIIQEGLPLTIHYHLIPLTLISSLKVLFITVIIQLFMQLFFLLPHNI